ncbi:MAG: 30S ribosomal protein S9 [Acidobacteria bacterium 13_1_20CM_2_57_8]|nr:MAG: 30S ribosomal protein S9 [Acidobacteria bacterium 13_1_40CM_2_56_5]OLE73852.1 MAG: 30S ribosomal protein S9 [Acidobacteria bacterium 13_1_20CM_2_57_8]
MSTVQHYGTGRRKTSTARVFLRPGTGNLTVNDKTLDQYFFNKTHQMIVKQPLEASDTLSKFDVVVNVEGGGMHGQAGAVQHGIARALVDFSAELRQVLKKAGFLTRDPRMKERKKYGQPGARKRFQFSKR